METENNNEKTVSRVITRRFDWASMKKDYISNPELSLAKIAEKYKVAKRTVEKRAAEGKWVEARKRVQALAAEDAELTVAKDISEVNRRHTTAYRNMQALASTQLTIAFNQLKSKQEEAQAKGRTLNIYEKGIISQHRMKSLFESLKIAIEGERVTLGLPITVTKSEVTGAEGGPLFEAVDINELEKLVNDTVQALTETK